MLPYRRIIFPVDYSPANLAIVPYVQEMSNRFSALLHLVHAVPPVMYYADEFGWQIAAPSPGHEEMVRKETARLEAFAAEHFGRQAPDVFVAVGQPAAVIEEVVRRHGADLIMLPTHGRGLFRRLLLGSVTARVIHDLSCSVWTGAHLAEYPEAAHQPYRKILCAIEPGRDSAHIVKAAECMAFAYSAELEFVSVIQWLSGNPTVDPILFWDQFRRAAENELAGYQLAAQIPTSARTVIGAISSALRDAASQQPADLLIVGRGDSQSPLSGVLSNLYAIIRDSPCPVLSV